jgi:CheY-like chemotaxis protein
LKEKELTLHNLKQKTLQTIAHEFKTPVISLISIIKSIVIPPTDKNFKKVKNLEELSYYIIYLVNDVIEFVNKDIVNLSFEKVNIESLLKISHKTLRNLLKHNYKERRIKTELIFDRNLKDHFVVSDKFRLLQIFFNVFSNIVKFTTTGTISISSKLTNEKSALITICDSGSGIHNNKLVSEDILDENGKILFGLSLCKKIAKLLSTELVITTDKNTNTIFMFEIKSFETSQESNHNQLEKQSEVQKPVTIKSKFGEIHMKSYFDSDGSGSNDEVNLQIENKKSDDSINELLAKGEEDGKQDSRLNTTLIRFHADSKRCKFTDSDSNNYKNEKDYGSPNITRSTIKFEEQFVFKPFNYATRQRSMNTSQRESIYKHLSSNIFCRLTQEMPRGIMNGNLNRSVLIGSGKTKLRKYFTSNSLKKHYEMGLGEIAEKAISDYKVPTKSKVDATLKNSSTFKLDMSKINRDRINSVESLRKLTVYIIDDYKFCRDLLDNVLRQLLCPTFETHLIFEHGHDGVCLLNKFVNSIDDLDNLLIFIDEDMEYMKGSEAVSILRFWEKEKNVKGHVQIISITAYNDEATRNNIKQAGVDHILSKPPKKSEINELFSSLGLYEKLKNL